MQYTDHQLAEFKREFARRKRNQLMVAIPVVAALLLTSLFKNRFEQAFEGASPALAGSVLVISLIVMFSYTRRNWRCPACDGYLGRSTSMKHCPGCGVPLK